MYPRVQRLGHYTPNTCFCIRFAIWEPVKLIKSVLLFLNKKQRNSGFIHFFWKGSSRGKFMVWSSTWIFITPLSYIYSVSLFELLLTELGPHLRKQRNHFRKLSDPEQLVAVCWRYWCAFCATTTPIAKCSDLLVEISLLGSEKVSLVPNMH